jgi:hypothetical protein
MFLVLFCLMSTLGLKRQETFDFEVFLFGSSTFFIHSDFSFIPGCSCVLQEAIELYLFRNYMCPVSNFSYYPNMDANLKNCINQLKIIFHIFI